MKWTCRLLVCCLIGMAPVFAGFNESIPSWHWSYKAIERLQSQGVLLELNVMQKPYIRREVAASISNLSAQLKSGAVVLCRADQGLVERLKKEFTAALQQNAGSASLPIDLGLMLQNDYDQPVEGDGGYRGVYRGRAVVDYQDWLTVHNETVLDRYAYEDSMYTGKAWAGTAGYANQGYARIYKKPFNITIGRDELQWGVGRSGTLFLSGAAQSLNQLRAGFTWKNLNYGFVAAQLDRMDYVAEESVVHQGARRYLGAHRLELSLKENRVRFAISEALLYSGLYQEINWTYMNPFIPYYAAQINSDKKANMFGSIDLWAMPLPALQVYGSLLIDDIQVEETGPGDLEPNEIGFIVGAAYGALLPGFSIDAEYVKVSNRTYNTPKSYESFRFKNKPLGHPLGNDFDLLQAGMDYWMNASLWVRLEYSQVRLGEGGLYRPFDMPWMDYTVDEGYSEPFPTGIVETQNRIKVELKYQPSIHWGIQGFFESVARDNAFNVKGASQSDTAWRIGFWWDGEMTISLK